MRPIALSDLWHIVPIASDIALMIEEFLVDCLECVRGTCSELRHAIDDTTYQAESPCPGAVIRIMLRSVANFEGKR